MMSLILRNPHSILAALEARPQDVREVWVPSKALAGSWSQVVRLAQDRRIGVRSGEEGARMGLAGAKISEKEPISLEGLFQEARQRKNGKGLWLALDSLQDPQNVGAIFRVAAFFEVQGILMTQERSASLTSTVYDVASGGVECVPFSIQTNLQRAFEKAKESGLWILGASEHATDDLKSIPRDRPWLLVIGNEEKGLRRLTGEACDVMCRISGTGKVGSLNAAVAAGILIHQLTA